MIATEALTYNYATDKTFHFPNIKVKAGEAMLILGKSGIGKTTLLHLLAGLMRPKEGHVMVNDVNLSNLSATEADRFRGKNISIIFQQNHFIASLTVLENLLLAQKLSGVGEDKTLCVSFLESLGIAEKASKYTKYLSQGERQRVSIARALVTKPTVILADEPTSALDDEHAQEVAKLLHDNALQVNAALLIVTHDHRLKEFFHQSITLS